MTREMVEKRAKEIAIINGRAPHDFTENDWVQAKHELLGIQDVEEIEEEEPVAALTRWDEEPGTSGHHVENEPAPRRTNLCGTFGRRRRGGSESRSDVEGQPGRGKPDVSGKRDEVFPSQQRYE